MNIKNVRKELLLHIAKRLRKFTCIVVYWGSDGRFKAVECGLFYVSECIRIGLWGSF